ncbi:AAA family ATPase [Terrihabitans sp. B22-R8]|uniref:AAA family ATPase n=1 Tax=Terrihabitans sp. B22-R8 TaxID=3425128 RepID=UPI00403C284C
MTETDRFFVVTGGPGSGKTTLIEALRSIGHAATEEAGRGIIRHQSAIGGQALPWHDRVAFAELMLSWEMRSHEAAHLQSGPVFFDRGAPDVVGYLRLSGLPVPEHAERAALAFRYNRRVFVAPPWEAIFVQDTERRQDFAEAVLTYETMRKTYQGYGYEIVELPIAQLAERVAFVLAEVGA